jgi:hypothetical protein
MITYAWANPATLVREQDASKDGARLRVWHEMQAAHSTNVAVYEQEPIGSIGKETLEYRKHEPWEGYAWASPQDGRRMMAATIGEAQRALQTCWPENDVSESVTLYRHRHSFWVYYEEPEPPAPLPPEPVFDTPESLILGVQEQRSDLAYASVLAHLWMAQALRKMAGMSDDHFIQHPNPVTFDPEPDQGTDPEEMARRVKEREPLDYTGI